MRSTEWIHKLILVFVDHRFQKVAFFCDRIYIYIYIEQLKTGFDILCFCAVE